MNPNAVIGCEYAKAKRRAQANANFFKVSYVLTGYGGAWYVERLSSYTNAIPEGAEIIKPEKEAAQ